MNKIKDFKDLNTWREAHKLVLMIYGATKTFPREEIFSLTSQVRRAAISITSNIAEGFGRQGYKEKIQFYYFAQGSLIELKNQKS
jgi:four helix bundle protein